MPAAEPRNAARAEADKGGNEKRARGTHDADSLPACERAPPSPAFASRCRGTSPRQRSGRVDQKVMLHLSMRPVSALALSFTRSFHTPLSGSLDRFLV